MTISSRIPKEFYKLFHSKYMEYYQLILISLYEESSQSYSLLGLTEEECEDVIEEKMTAFTLDWSQEQYEEGRLMTRSNMPSVFLGNLKNWGWLRSDYDESLNSYVISFPDYSQLFVELFHRLHSENSSMERESLLTLYSHLFTYHSTKEKDNQILKSALHTAKALSQMLANMQEGIRGYFEELSKQKTFLGIQDVLVQEINNSDSQKYAILTTSDSFYRYKEEVKELIEANLEENENQKAQILRECMNLEKGTTAWARKERVIQSFEEAMEILFQINREFDGIERRYNRLIDQKRTFAKRAAARIRYILLEGDAKEDRAKALVKLLNESDQRDEILEKLSQKMGLTMAPRIIKERSLARPRMMTEKKFVPIAMEQEGKEKEELQDFVVKPLYTRREIAEFRRKNEENGVFRVTKDTVRSVEDMEKLLFVWQEATELYDNKVNIEIEDEFVTEEGYAYSGFSMERK